MKKRNLTPYEVTPHVLLRRLLQFIGTGLQSSPYNLLLLRGSGQGKNLLNAAFPFFSIALLPILAWGSLFLGTSSAKTEHGQKVSFFPLYLHQNERAELATIQPCLLPAYITPKVNFEVDAQSSPANKKLDFSIKYSGTLTSIKAGQLPLNTCSG